MSGSILIYGGNKEARKDKASEILKIDLKPAPDVFIVKPEEGKKSIGISQARQAINFLQEKPFELKSKYLIILDAEKLTTPAQNALLKTLEEPPSYANIILIAKLQNSLLETVVSRCRLIQVKSQKRREEPAESLKKIIKMSLGQRLDYAQELAKEEKEELIETLESWIEEERNRLLKAPNQMKSAKNIKKIVQIKKDLENTNANLRLSLETLLLSLSED